MVNVPAVGPGGGGVGVGVGVGVGADDYRFFQEAGSRWRGGTTLRANAFTRFCIGPCFLFFVVDEVSTCLRIEGTSVIAARLLVVVVGGTVLGLAAASWAQDAGRALNAPPRLRLREAIAKSLAASPRLRPASEQLESAAIQQALAASRFGLKITPQVTDRPRPVCPHPEEPGRRGGPATRRDRHAAPGPLCDRRHTVSGPLHQIRRLARDRPRRRIDFLPVAS